MAKPSNFKEAYWIYAKPPMEKEKKIIEFAVDWIKRESESYLRSGLI